VATPSAAASLAARIGHAVTADRYSPRRREIGQSVRVAPVPAEEVEVIDAWLASNRFVVIETRESASVGFRLQQWQSGDSLVRITRNGGRWFVEVSRSDWDEWFEIDLVNYVCDFRQNSALGRTKAAAHADIDHLLPALRSALRSAREHERPRRVVWWPEKWAVPTGANMGGEPLVGYRYAWWQWRQRLRCRSVRNLHRWYLQPIIFGRNRT